MNDNDLNLLGRIARAGLARYGLAADLPLALVNLSENATYRVDMGEKPAFALRVHRPDYHSREAIASELSWLTALRAEGVVTTPEPVPGLDGETIQQVSLDVGASRHVVLSRWEEGSEPHV